MKGDAADRAQQGAGYDGLTHILKDAAHRGGDLRAALCGTKDRPSVHGGINVATCTACREAYIKSPDAEPFCAECGYRHRKGDESACRVLKDMRGGTVH